MIEPSSEKFLAELKKGLDRFVYHLVFSMAYPRLDGDISYAKPIEESGNQQHLSLALNLRSCRISLPSKICSKFLYYSYV
ncbi:Protein MGF 360-10L [Gossypium australe]|uniref:Protein MGF 360-10L n=1 Tax=Gossypium australe TaxID=47621 RepID=A0A5B6WE86_9ROSI|nr:Protein MGF 360-10L [Gossypium australe]